MQNEADFITCGVEMLYGIGKLLLGVNGGVELFALYIYWLIIEPPGTCYLL